MLFYFLWAKIKEWHPPVGNNKVSVGIDMFLKVGWRKLVTKLSSSFFLRVGSFSIFCLQWILYNSLIISISYTNFSSFIFSWKLEHRGSRALGGGLKTNN